MYIQQIRNATLKIKYGGIVFLTDPWFQDKGTGVSVKTVRAEMEGIKCPMNDLPDTPAKILEDVDYCLVTHLHFDHFSRDYLPGDLKMIAQNRTDADTLCQMGFENVRWFDTEDIRVDGVTIHKTTAVHGENDAVIEKMGDACGYVFESSSEKVLYLAGDTVYCGAVKDTIDRYQPGVIILNCCEAAIPLGRLIMGLADVEMVCQWAPEALVVASHLDSVNHALISSDDVRRFARARNLPQIKVPVNGEILEI